MECPRCLGKQVMVSGGKHTVRGNYRRYRRCTECGYTFTTIEYYVPSDKVRCKRNRMIKEGSI